MKQVHAFGATAVIVLCAAGAYASWPASTNLAGEVPLAAVDSEEDVPQNGVSGPGAVAGGPNICISAARGTERSFEHRDPPPKHLVAFERGKDPEFQRPLAC